jgi:kinesin family protein 2/24
VPAEQRIQFKQRSAYPVRTENKVKFAEDPTIIQIKPAPIKEINTVRRNSIVPAPNKRQVKPVTEPLSERRTMFANERRLRENFIENNQGNPNWEIYKMILDYKSGLVFQPLRPSDTVINDQICVCIRKRPLSSKEKAANEIEVIF